jgi:hypothetical protein
VAYGEPYPVKPKVHKECKDKMELTRTLVAIPDGYKYVEITSIGKIRAKPIKNISSGISFRAVIFDEIIDKLNREGERIK